MIPREGVERIMIEKDPAYARLLVIPREGVESVEDEVAARRLSFPVVIPREGVERVIEVRLDDNLIAVIPREGVESGPPPPLPIQN